MIDRKQERIQRFQRKKKQKNYMAPKPKKVIKHYKKPEDYYEDYE